MRIGDTVVIDGDLSLIIPVDGDINLLIPMDGESGVVTKVTEYDLPIYTGQTVVDPDFVGITLPTANKTVISDIRVNPIEVESVSNLSGGRTVYIGGII